MALPAQRVRDVNLWLRAFMAEQQQKGLGPPEKVGGWMMSSENVIAYFNGKGRYEIKRQLAELPSIRLGKIKYWHIHDIARWMVQKEMEGAS